MQSQPEPTPLFEEEFISTQFQRRYLYTQIDQMIQLCYPTVVTNNQKITEQDIPKFIDCVNKLNFASAFIANISQQLADASEAK